MFYFDFGFDKPAKDPLKGNKGEWSEIYIFLKLLEDGKVCAADKNMQKVAERYLKILKIFREEIEGHRLAYIPGKQVEVFDGEVMACSPVEMKEVGDARSRAWTLIKSTQRGVISDSDLQGFLRRICIAKLKSPAEDVGYFGGTKDIVMQVHDYNTGIDSILGFSCKSEFSAQATLFNASKDNTNFLFKVDGGMDDALAEEFNSLCDVRGRKQVVATARRMRLLKERGCALEFVRVVSSTARRNLRMVGGRDLSTMVAEMLRHYYFDGEGAVSYSSVSSLVDWLSQKAVIDEDEPGEVKDVCRYQISHLLYAMFTGMRLGTPWNGRTSVCGGYIVARDDGEVLAYHTCIADEFKDFLVQRLALEQPSHSRHLSLRVEKGKDGSFYIKLPLQIRFRANRERDENAKISV